MRGMSLCFFHGANRLGGNSLAETLVFVKIAGARVELVKVPKIDFYEMFSKAYGR